MKQFAFFLFLVFIASSCVDVIEFEPPESSISAFSIQGKLNKGNPSTIQVSLQKVFDFQNVNSFPRFKQVLLLDEVGNEIELETRSQGFYNKTIPNDHPTFKVDYGKKYKLRLITNEQEVYESEYDEIQPVATPDSLVVRQIFLDVLDPIGVLRPRPFISFYINTPTKVEGSTVNSRFLWEMAFTYKITDSPQNYTPEACCRIPLERNPKPCYITEAPVRNYIPFDATQKVADYLKDIELYVQPPYFVFAEGFYLTVYQQAISENAFNYWAQANLSANRTGDVFEEPAGRIITNFKKIGDETQEVYGFFYATEEKAIRAYASPELANNPDIYCPPPPKVCAPVVCCNCAYAENSTPIKPDWWIE